MRMEVLLATAGLVLISILMARRFSSAILLGIVAITLAGIPLGLSHWPTRFFSLPHPSGTFLQLDLRAAAKIGLGELILDRKSTRLNSSHGYISYAVSCLKKKKETHKVHQGEPVGGPQITERFLLDSTSAITLL